ncbi:ABC transporter ATP-binding protein/permease [Neisseria bacilliformis]|nr:ABC transporter ATP-binding protein/permease [Neisseria bacilliformis]
MKTIRRFLSLAAPFWWRNNSWFNWLILAAVVGFSLAIVRVGVLITDWNKTFYDALAAFDGKAMPALIVEFLVYIALVTGFIACGNWLRKVLLFRWREHLTRQFQQNWLGGHKHYRLQLTGEPDNPDQRIAEDVAMLSEKSIDLFKYFIMNAAKLGAFVEILWQFSGVQTFTLFGQSITVKGYLVWIALAYSAACTLLTHLIGRKLQPLNVERQHREADYRATLLRVRESAEQIAFYRGETAEEGCLNSRFAAVKSNWRGLIRREFYLESFSAAYLRLSMFIPIIATLPIYLAHSMSFGDMMKARSAFSNVQDGFGWFMDYYKRIIEWAAVVERLAGFQAALGEADKAARSSENLTDTPVGRILESDKISTAQETPDVGWVLTHQPGTNGGSRPTLLAENLSIHTAEGSLLLHNLTLAAVPRQWLLLDGRSGIGKTTLMRTLAGLWPYYHGGFQVNSKRVLFLPQRPYLPQDTLAKLVCYPASAPQNDNDIRAALEKVGLDRLNSRLHSEEAWHKILSRGEQQRVSLARALIARPEILFLDEATNQLDDASATELLSLLKRELPDTLVIGISHQPPVKALFDRHEDLGAFAAQN